MAVESFMVELGSPVAEFTLPSVDDRTVSLGDFADRPALLVAFMCNHCPYVKHIESVFGELTKEYEGKGVATVAVCSNDLDAYPDDRPPGLRAQAARAGFTFPYLVDETQAIAKAYSAACTPDLFVYDADRRLMYRGEFDGSRPSNDVPVTGDSLRRALDLTLDGQPVPEPHTPSIGCGLKWKAGNEPGLNLL